MPVKLLAEHHLEFLSLKRGCTGSYESTLAKMPHCLKSHVAAQLFEFTGTGKWADLVAAGKRLTAFKIVQTIFSCPLRDHGYSCRTLKLLESH